MGRVASGRDSGLAGAIEMHELSIVLEIQKCVASAAQENGIALSSVAAVVVEVGEASAIVPRYLQSCWPAVLEGTQMEGAQLKIEMIKAEVRCKSCGKVYEYLACERRCPDCGAPECLMFRGQEMNIREILVR